jgi:hypothetical protein
MLEIIGNKPFLAAILAGAAAQTIKVVTFLLIEKRVNYRRLVQTEGSPNMHSAAMSALTLAVGFKSGFGSLVFALSICLSLLVMVDTLNVRNATSKQAAVIYFVVERLRMRKHPELAEEGPYVASPSAQVSYSLVDVLSGVVLGVVMTMLLV